MWNGSGSGSYSVTPGSGQKPYAARSLADAVKEAAVLSEVVAESGVEVERRGGTTYARCPFHGDGNERTPSFSIDDERGCFHCFGCQEGGDVFAYLKLKENLTFKEALHMLAARYEVERPAGDGWVSRRPRPELPPPPPPMSPEEQRRLLDAVEAAASHYAASLHRPSAKATECAAMLRKRGVTTGMASLFRLGYAPSYPSDHLSSALQSKGFTEKEIIDAGLAVRTTNTLT